MAMYIIILSPTIQIRTSMGTIGRYGNAIIALHKDMISCIYTSPYVSGIDCCIVHVLQYCLCWFLN